MVIKSSVGATVVSRLDIVQLSTVATDVYLWDDDFWCLVALIDVVLDLYL